jgi:hypothetical protein
VVPLTGLARAPTISGTPTAAGKWTFTLKVTDASATPLSATSASLSITIYSVWAQACDSSGNEAVLSGQYAFTLSGFNGTGYLAVAGAFAADGTGRITAGEADTNGVLGAQTASIDAGASAYSVGSDNRGCATIATSFGTFNARFALGTFSSGVATEGHVIEWESGWSAYIGAGHILQQTASSFSGGPSGSYVYGVSGWDPSVPGPMAIAGVLTASGGAFSDVDQDINDAGTPTPNMTGLTGTYTNFDRYDRGTASFYYGGSLTSTATLYMVSASKFFYLQSSTPFLIGEFDQQTVPSGGFTNSSLNGPAVFFTNAADNGGAGADANFGLFTANGMGTATVADYDDDDGTLSPVENFSCTYSVASNGRTTLAAATGGCESHPPVFYLTGANTGYIVGTGERVDFGALEPQVGSDLTTASLSGIYYFGPVEVVNQAVSSEVGVLTLDGSGGISYVRDLLWSYGEGPDENSTGTVTVNSDGTFSGFAGGATMSGVVISSTKFVLIDDTSDRYPAILVAKQ